MVRTASTACLATFALAACTVFDGLTFTPDAGADAAFADGAAADGGGGYASAVLADAPVAYWRFEDGASTTARDATGHGNDCEIVGTAKRGAPSVAASTGAAIDFDGKPDSYVRCRDAPFDFGGTASFTLEAWIQPRVADAVYRKVFSKDKVDGPRDGYNLSVVQPGVARIERFAGGQMICGLVMPIRLDAWNHVVGTFDGAVLRLYVDGNVGRADCPTTPMPDTPAILTFGAQSDLGYGFFDGVVDELAVYDHALTSERIAAHRDAAR